MALDACDVIDSAGGEGSPCNAYGKALNSARIARDVGSRENPHLQGHERCAIAHLGRGQTDIEYFSSLQVCLHIALGSRQS